jgi:hypothetical protein
MYSKGSPNGPRLAGLRRAPSRPTWSTMSTTSRLKNSSRQLVGRLARKVESDSPVGIPGAPGRLVDDLKTELLPIRKLAIASQDGRRQPSHTVEKMKL